MAPSSYKLFSSQITLITILILSSSLANGAKINQRPFNKIYAFGDSFTDTGNTHSSTGPNGFRYVSNLPYGITFFHHPTNRYTDGRLVIDFVTEALSLPFLPPYRSIDPKPDFSNGVNFAVAGSTAINHGFFVDNNLTLDITPESIQTQLGWFEKFLEKQGCGLNSKCNEGVFDDALIWVGEIGVNDYAYITGSTVSRDTIRDLAIKSVTEFLQALLEKGVKYVVVQGLPPTGCLPLAMLLSPINDRDDIGCVGSINKQTQNHNDILQSKLQDLRVQFPHSVIVYADYYDVYHTVMQNPSKYDIKEKFKVCCGSGDDQYNFNYLFACGSPNVTSCSNPYSYINWDGVHLTEGMYKVVSDMFLRGQACHPPFSYLLSKKQNDK